MIYLTHYFKRFLQSEKAGGILLLLFTVASLIMANSPSSNSYTAFWNVEIQHHTLTDWINDGLMALFFLMIGLELEREFYQGELSQIQNAVLPLFAAVGGMLGPFLIYMSLNYGTATDHGFGIPMATDIAFAIAALSVLGKRIPASLKVFLIAMAVIDDLGAILIIAFLYTKTIYWTYLFLGLAVFCVLLLLNKLKVNHLLPYIIGGILMWFLFLQSGVHATISGVLLAFAIPFRDGGEKTPSSLVLHHLHWPIAFLVLPMFAAANTGIVFDGNVFEGMAEPHNTGIMLGLIVGKPLGILLLTAIAVYFKWGQLPQDIKWSHLLGAGLLGGIGFTMSIFISLLAFDDIQLVNDAKIAILFGSFISAALGILFLCFATRKNISKPSIGP